MRTALSPTLAGAVAVSACGGPAPPPFKPVVAGVDDIHFHPAVPRTIRISAVIGF